MKVTQKKVEDGRVQLDAVASANEVNEAFNVAQLMFAQSMGLRPEGEKPIAQVAQERLGIQDLDSVVAPQATEYLIPFALDKKNIIPAYPPEMATKKALKRGEEYSFTIEVALKPDYELTSYDPIEITVPPFSINEAEVENQLAQMADSYAEYVADDPHPVASGDHVLLAMETTKDGEPVEGLTTDSRTYTAGIGLMPEGFDNNIIGMDVGETKTFTFSGPGLDDEGNPVDESFETTATVKEIQKKVIPAITDVWVKQFMPMFASVDMLKDAIRSQFEQQVRPEYDNFVRGAAASELAKRFQGKIADEVYESMQKQLMNNLQSQLKQQGMSFEQFVEQNGGQQQFSMMMMMQTRENLIQGYALDALYRHEKLSVTDEDILEACKAMNPQNPAAVRESMEKAGCGFALREMAERHKAGTWLIEHAKITIQE